MHLTKKKEANEQRGENVRGQCLWARSFKKRTREERPAANLLKREVEAKRKGQAKKKATRKAGFRV